MPMNLLTFRGGVHPPHNKHKTEHLALIKARVPGLVIIPLQQHIGATCEPVVKVGDRVKLGQNWGTQGVCRCAGTFQRIGQGGSH